MFWNVSTLFLWNIQKALPPLLPALMSRFRPLGPVLSCIAHPTTFFHIFPSFGSVLYCSFSSLLSSILSLQGLNFLLPNIRYYVTYTKLVSNYFILHMIFYIHAAIGLWHLICSASNFSLFLLSIIDISDQKSKAHFSLILWNLNSISFNIFLSKFLIIEPCYLVFQVHISINGQYIS
jgi:hypothetical protein